MIVVGGVGAVVIVRKNAQRRAERAIEERRAALEPLVDALAAQITDLEPDVTAPGPRAAAAKADHDEAVMSYGEVRDASPPPRAARRP